MKKIKFELLTLGNVEALPDLEYLVDGVLPVPCFGVLYGAPGSGKSFVALAMALSVASGSNWMGRSVRKGSVLYVAAEGILGMKARIAAHKKKFSLEDKNIRFIAAPFDTRSNDIKTIIDVMRSCEFQPDFIIVDTLARVSVGADENSAKDMGQVVEGLDKLKRETNAAVLVIHHTRKDGSAIRGSSVLHGAVDVLIACEATETANGQGVDLSCAKMKDDEPFAAIGIRLEKVELQNGKSSLVASGTYDIVDEISGNSVELVEILKDKFSEQGATNAELRKAFMARSGRSKSSFDRALKQAKGNSLLEQNGTGKGARYFPIGVSLKSVSDSNDTNNND